MEAFVRPVGHLYKTQWKMPLLCALSLHLFILGASLVAPDIFQSRPKFAKIQMVNLVNLSLPAPPSTPKSAPPPQKKAQPQPKPAPAKKVVPKKKVAPKPVPPKKVVTPAKTVEPVAPDAPPKTISLNPKRKKIKKKIVQPQKKSTANRERAKRKAREIAQRLKQEALLEKEAQLAAERARLAQQALEEEKALLQKADELPDIPPVRQPSVTNTLAQRRGASSQNKSSAIEQQYTSTVGAIIESHWALPPDLENQSTLQAVAVIRVNRNGRIIDMFFEKKSANTMYNQFVVNTINASNPLPPIPAALDEQEIEFHMTFSPEGVR